MRIRVNNLFAGVIAPAGKEKVMALLEKSAFKIERIVSRSHRSPPGFWYDQAEEEWVILMRGQATLEFADGQRVELQEGDYLTIPPHVKHRVQETAPETIWLAVHVKAGR